VPALLDGLGPQDQDVVRSRGTVRRFARNQVVFHDRDSSRALHLVTAGHFAVRTATASGNSVTLRIIGPGEHFGELAAVAPGPRTGSVVALDGAETLSWPPAEIERLRVESKQFEDALIRTLVAEVRRLAEALVEALYLPAENRVWRRLHDLACLYGPGPTVTIPLTQDDLAELAGTARPTTNRVLRQGARAGIVRLGRGCIDVLDVAGLGRRATE
jgi:CRP-like cAMP-binding protein